MRRSLAFLLLASSVAVPAYDIGDGAFSIDEDLRVRIHFLPGKLGQVKFRPLVST